MADYLTTLILSSHDGPLFVSERSCEARKRASATPLCHYFTRRHLPPGQDNGREARPSRERKRAVAFDNRIPGAFALCCHAERSEASRRAVLTIADQAPLKISGGFTDGATPVPIPNTVVKPVPADGSPQGRE